jgi:hypothetical protein
MIHGNPKWERNVTGEKMTKTGNFSHKIPTVGENFKKQASFQKKPPKKVGDHGGIWRVSYFFLKYSLMPSGVAEISKTLSSSAARVAIMSFGDFTWYMNIEAMPFLTLDAFNFTLVFAFRTSFSKSVRDC